MIRQLIGGWSHRLETRANTHGQEHLERAVRAERTMHVSGCLLVRRKGIEAALTSKNSPRAMLIPGRRVLFRKEGTRRAGRSE